MKDDVVDARSTLSSLTITVLLINEGSNVFIANGTARSFVLLT